MPHGAVGPSTLSGEGPGAPAVDTLNNLFYEYLNLNGAVVPEFPPPPSGFQWDTGPFETSTPTFVSKGAQRLEKSTSLVIFA